ncbi:unnamed protein product, partial [Scytosiphon promiscuus]
GGPSQIAPGGRRRIGLLAGAYSLLGNSHLRRRPRCQLSRWHPEHPTVPASLGVPEHRGTAGDR